MTKVNAEGKKEFIADPIEVAKFHSKPWEAEWGAYHPSFNRLLVPFFKTLRQQTLNDAEEFAEDLNASALKVRQALKQFSNGTATGSDNLHLRRMGDLPDTALEKLSCLFKQSVATLTVPMQHPGASWEEGRWQPNDRHYGFVL